MKWLTIALALLVAPALSAQPNPTTRSWNRPVDPYRIAGPVYSVGASDITSFLITTSDGHVLVNSGFVETVPIIEANVRRLGFRLEDVKLILASHAHFDHVGGHAALRARTGARVLVSEGDAEAVRTGGRIFDPGGGGYIWPACPVDRVLHDGEVVTLVVQAKVSIRDCVAYDGTTVREVGFQSQDEYVYLEADTDDKGKFELRGTTIVKVQS